MPTNDKLPTDLVGLAGDILPDAVEITQADEPTQSLKQIADTRNECDRVASAIVSDYQSAVAKCRAVCDSESANCIGCYYAAINGIQQKLNATRGKCAAAVTKALNQKLAQTVEYVQSLGVPPPTVEQVETRLAGGIPLDGKLSKDEALAIVQALGVLKCPDGSTPQTDFNNCPYCVVNTSGDPRFPKLQTLYLQADFSWGTDYDNTVCQVIAAATGITGGTGVGTAGGPMGQPVSGGNPNQPESPPPASGPAVPPQENGGQTPVTGICPGGEVPNGFNPDGTPNCLSQPSSPFPPPVATGTGGETSGGPSGGGTSGTPTTPPPTVIDGICCYPPVPSQFVGCVEVPRPAQPYWAVVDLSDCLHPKVCTYQGDLPPAVADTNNLHGPYSDLQEAFDVAINAVKVCVATSPPPVIPPVVPPPVTPPPTQQPPDQPPPQSPGTPQLPEDKSACSVSTLVTKYKGLQSGDFSGIDVNTDSVAKAICHPETDSAPAGADAFWEGLANSFNPFSSLWPNFTCQNTVAPFVSFAIGLVDTLTQHQYCDNKFYLPLAIKSAIVGFADRWLNIVPSVVTANAQYELNMACQWLIPSANEMHQLNVKGFLTDEEWQAGVAANGLCIPWAHKLKEASYSYPSIAESVSLFLRGVITDDQLADLMIFNGVKDDETAKRFRELARFVPGPSDLVRFMVRDVFDDNVVRDLQLDNEFDQKFTGRALDWAKSQGIDTEVMRDFWRSHWQIPSASQMYDALHRIREDKTLPDGVTVAKAVTIDEIIKTLKINDMSPAWVERLAYLSYNPLNKRDIRSLFEQGVITRKDVTDSFQDLGYSPDDAETLTTWIEKITAEKRNTLSGGYPVKDTMRMYSDNGINRTDAKFQLTLAGLSDEQATQMLDYSDSTRRAKWRSDNIKALRRRFLMGEYDSAKVQAKLSDYGVDNDAINGIISQWQEELQLKYKQPAISALCKWLGKGYIQPQDFINRVQNLGYTLTDAANFANDCVSDLADKRRKEAAALAKQRQAELEKQRKAAEKQAKDSFPCRTKPKPYCGVSTNGKASQSASDSGNSSPA